MTSITFGRLIIIIILVTLLFGDISKIINTIIKSLKKIKILKKKKK